MAPTSLTLLAGFLAVGSVLAAPVAKPQSGATFTLGNPETTVSFEPGFAPPKDSPDYAKWLWFYWLNKYKEEHEDDDRYDDRYDGPRDGGNIGGNIGGDSSSVSSTISWGKRGEPVRGGLPICTSVKKGVACLGNPTTTVTVTNPPDEEPEWPEDPEYPEYPDEEPEDDWPPQQQPPKGNPGWPSPPKYPTKPQPPKYPGGPKDPPKWPQEPEYPEPEWPEPEWPEPEEPQGGSITTSTYCTNAKKGVTWDC